MIEREHGEPTDPTLARAYREAAAADSGPPAQLDDAIRAAARRAVAAGPRGVAGDTAGGDAGPGRAKPAAPARTPWSRRYAVPLALAATVMLAVGVTLRTFEHEEQTHARLDMRIPSEDRTLSQAPLRESDAAPVKPEHAEIAGNTDSAAKSESLRKQRAETPDTAGRTAAGATPAAPPAESAAVRIEQGAVPPAPQQDRSSERAAEATPPAAPVPSPPATERFNAARPAPESAPAGTTAPAPPPAKLAAPAPPPAAAPPAAAPAMREERTRQLRPDAADRVTARAPEAGAPAAAVPSLGAAASSEARRIAGPAGARAETAEQLFERIRVLRRGNRPDEARRAATELRERFPEAVIPEDLREFFAEPGR